MKNKCIAVLVMGLGFAWAAQAADSDAGKGLTPEQQRERAALIQKYDVNKDGVLDKTEAKNMSKADKKALAKLDGIGTAKKAAKGEKSDQKAKDAQKSADTKAGKAGKNADKAPSDAEKRGKDKEKQ